jgi:CHASE3 domain sensor protein
MTLRNRLYMNFGAVLFMVLVMFGVNWRAISREHDAKTAAKISRDLKDATEAVRSQLMQNRLYLSNYLLSGDTREVDHMNEGIRHLNDKLERRPGNPEQEKAALEKVQQLEQNWEGIRTAAGRQAQGCG